MFDVTASYMTIYDPARKGKMPEEKEVSAFIAKRQDWVQEAFAIFPADPKKRP